jgi:hypothetical protein
MGVPFKLTDEDLKRTRLRVRAGEHQTHLADEFCVDRKTIRRRLDALEHAEAERAEQVAEKRLRRQAARDKREWVGRASEVAQASGNSSQEIKRLSDPHSACLDRQKSLSGRALSEAAELVHRRRPDGSSRRLVERADVEARLDEGRLLD